MQYISEHNLSRQNLYLNGGAVTAFRYYEKTGFVDLANFDKVYKGTRMWKTDTTDLITMADSDQGFWLLLSHIDREEERSLLKYMASSGHIPDKVFKATGANTYYFGITDR